MTERTTHNPPIGKAEIKRLGTIASAAAKNQIEKGLLTFPKGRKTATIDAWRKKVLFETLGCESTKEVRRSDFRTLEAAFLDLAGKHGEAFRKLVKTGKRKDSVSDKADTHEEAELWTYKLKKLLESEAAKKALIGEDYVLKIAQSYGGKRDLRNWRKLPAYQLRALFITINRRLQNKGKKEAWTNEDNVPERF